MSEPDRCPYAPQGESHRWQLPSTGHALPATCKWCHAARTFPGASDSVAWATLDAERWAASLSRGGLAARAVRQQRRPGNRSGRARQESQ